MKPIPLLNREQIAHVLAIGAPAVTKLEAEGLPRTNPGERGALYDVRAVVQWWLDRKTRQTTAQRAPGGLNEVEQRARYYSERADSLARENAQKSGRLVEPELIERVLTHAVTEIARALDALPSQIKVEIPHLRASEVQLIATRIARTRNALARMELRDAV